MKYLRIVSLITVLLLLGCHVVKPTPKVQYEQTVKIIYTGDLSWTDLPRLAALIATEQPSLSVVNGRILDGGLVTYQYMGRAELEALAASGVNAVTLTPDFLRLGTRYGRKLLDSVAANITFLNTGINDTLRKVPLGRPSIKVSVGGTGPVRSLALLGAVADGNNRYLQQAGIAWQTPQEAARQPAAELKVNTDLVGIALAPNSEVDIPGADFLLGSRTFGTALPDKPARSAWRLELLIAGGRVVDRRVTEVKLASVTPDPRVQALVQGYEAQMDSTLSSQVNDFRLDFDVPRLKKQFLRAAPNVTHTDGALFGNTIQLKPLAKGPFTFKQLFDLVNADAELVRVTLIGAELKDLTPKGEPGIEWRGIYRTQRVLLHKEYNFVTTTEYLGLNPKLAGHRIEYLPYTPVQILAFALRVKPKAAETPEE